SEPMCSIVMLLSLCFFTTRRRHPTCYRDWSSTCALPISPASVTLTWAELARLRTPARFTIETVPSRLERLKVAPLKDYWTTRQRDRKRACRERVGGGGGEGVGREGCSVDEVCRLCVNLNR